MKLRPLANFCRRMGVGLRAGVDIMRVLETEARTGDQQHRVVMRKVADDVRDGATLAKAMFNAPKKYFPPLLIQMVHASELGGRVESTFSYMAEYYDDLLQTRNFFFQRITWPCIQLIMAVGIIGLTILIQGIMTPQAAEMYDASGTGLTGVRGFFIYCAIVGSVFFVVGTAIFGIWKNWFNAHRYLMPVVQRIPKLGEALITLGVSRFSMTLSMLLNAGVEAKRSTKQAFMATGNQYYMQGMDRALESIERGESFGQAIDVAAVFPQDFVEAVHIGELSGTETESLDHLATQYRHRAKAALNTLATVASLAIWLTVMCMIGFMVLRLGMQYVNMLNGFLPK